MAKTIELYSALKDKLGEAETMLLIDTIEESHDISFTGLATKENLAKVEGRLREDLAKVEGRLREDLVKVDGRLTQVEGRLREDMLKLEVRLGERITSLEVKMKLYFIVLICIMLFTNPKAMDIIAKLLGLVK